MRVSMLGWVCLSVSLALGGCEFESVAVSDDGDGGGDILGDTVVFQDQDLEEVSVERAGNPQVTFQTTLGDFTIELHTEAAPITTANILSYVESGFYDGKDGLGATSFHRVIPEFMAQGGGITAAGVNKTTQAPIVNESTNGLQNIRGSVAMARTNDPNSATSQFFVNVVDNAFLNYASPAEPGYAVFGEVVEGMETVDAIVAVETNGEDVPLEAIEIVNVVVE